MIVCLELCDNQLMCFSSFQSINSKLSDEMEQYVVIAEMYVKYSYEKIACLLEVWKVLKSSNKDVLFVA